MRAEGLGNGGIDRLPKRLKLSGANLDVCLQ